MARPTGILIAALLLATGAMLGALTSASRSAASRVRGESPPAGPDTAPAQLAPAAALPPSPTRPGNAQPPPTSGDDEKIAPQPLLVSRDAGRPPRPESADCEAAPRSSGPGRAWLPRPAAGLAQAPPEPPRFKVRDEQGQPVVARLHGQHEGKTVLILPDGQLGIPNMLVPTNEPFQPFTAEELLARLQKGPLRDFHVQQTPHYLIFYQSSRAFAESSGRWLEDLYRRLLDAFRKHEMAAHDTEFPLVAVIYRTERDFRASKRVDPEVQAFYEIYTNRIYFYETSEHDENCAGGLCPAQASDGRSRRNAPDPAEHRRPPPTERLADLAGGGSGRVLFHPGQPRAREESRPGTAWG